MVITVREVPKVFNSENARLTKEEEYSHWITKAVLLMVTISDIKTHSQWKTKKAKN